MRKTIAKALFIVLLLSYQSVMGQDFKFPVIKEWGGVVELKNAILPKSGGKILIDLTSSEVAKSGVSKSMDRIARLVNLYGLAGIDSKQLEVVVIIHGSATKSVLTDEAYNEKYGSSNPDLPLIEVLKKHNVQFMVCGQALIRRGFDTIDLNPKVDLALSAITVLAEYQQNGYSVLYY